MKSFFKTTLVVLLACNFSVSSFAHPTDPAPPSVPTVETLTGLITDYDSFTIQVESNGCTDKSSFDVAILESHPAQIQISRWSPDHCRGNFPYGTKLTFTYAELGLSSPESFFIINEVNPGLLPKR